MSIIKKVSPGQVRDLERRHDLKSPDALIMAKKQNLLEAINELDVDSVGGYENLREILVEMTELIFDI